MQLTIHLNCSLLTITLYYIGDEAFRVNMPEVPTTSSSSNTSATAVDRTEDTTSTQSSLLQAPTSTSSEPIG